MVAADRKSRRRAGARRFYETALHEAEKLDLARARDIEGMDEEIAMLRLRLRQAIEARPEDLPLLFRGIEILARVVSSRFKLSGGDERELVEKLRGAMEGLQDVWPEVKRDG